MATATDIRALVPRVRRAVSGFDPDVTLSDDVIKDIVADAMSWFVLHTGSVFGHELVVTETDGNGAPEEYETDDALTLAEATAIAAQAGLDYFLRVAASSKTGERISDAGGSWEWTRSAQALVEQLRMLKSERDAALEAIADAGGRGMDIYTSFLSVRDIEVSRAVEPWVSGLGGVGGLQGDPRFGTYA